MARKLTGILATLCFICQKEPRDSNCSYCKTCRSQYNRSHKEKYSNVKKELEDIQSSRQLEIYNQKKLIQSLEDAAIYKAINNHHKIGFITEITDMISATDDYFALTQPGYYK